jgi:UDP-N-acetylglucosamine--N-acetylmuramyl-(pentapeptide) pyrophosphoryl-undecaprenol N-acetylglucosamine transferase
MVAAGGARLVPEGDDFVKRLGTEFERLAERGKLVAMAQAARSLAKPDAAAHIADACLEATA